MHAIQPPAPPAPPTVEMTATMTTTSTTPSHQPAALPLPGRAMPARPVTTTAKASPASEEASGEEAGYGHGV